MNANRRHRPRCQQLHPLVFVGEQILRAVHRLGRLHRVLDGARLFGNQRKRKRIARGVALHDEGNVGDSVNGAAILFQRPLTQFAGRKNPHRDLAL